MIAGPFTANPSPQRRRFLRTLAYLVVGLVAVDVTVACFADTWRAYDPVFYRDRLAAVRRHSHDLVVAGGSPAMIGFNATALEGLRWKGESLHNAFNLGLPMGTTTDVYHAVRHGLKTPPKLLVYGVSATDLNEDRVESAGHRFLMDAGDVVRFSRDWPAEAVGCGRNWAKERVVGVWQVYYHRDGIRRWAAGRAEALCPGFCPAAAAEARVNLEHAADLQTGRGVHSDSPSPPAYRLDVQKQRGTVPEFGFLSAYAIRHHLTYLHRLIDWAHERNVSVLLVDMPVPADLDEQRYAREYREYRALLAAVAEARKVRVLYATREAVGLTDADFADLIHLNGDGAERLSRWLRHSVEHLSPAEQDLRASAD